MKWIICKFFKHKYKVKRHIIVGVLEVYCTRCKREFGMSALSETIIPMDDELRELHNELMK